MLTAWLLLATTAAPGWAQKKPPPAEEACVAPSASRTGPSVRPGNRTIVVTGFEPFERMPTNPSGDIALHLRERRAGAGRGAYTVKDRVLPVDYDEAGRWVAAAVRQRPAAVLMFGVGARPGHILVEYVGNNRRCQEPQEPSPGDPDRGRIRELPPPPPKDASACSQPVVAGGPARYHSNAPPGLVDELVRQGVPAVASTFAGASQCNSTYYHALRAASQTGLRAPILFVHVPYPREQLQARPPAATSGPKREEYEQDLAASVPLAAILGWSERVLDAVAALAEAGQTPRVLSSEELSCGPAAPKAASR